MDGTERILWWLFGSSLGGPARIQIVREIRREPRNAAKLAQATGLDYTTVRHHLRILQRNGLVTVGGPKYGQLYFVSSQLQAAWPAFERIAATYKASERRPKPAAGPEPDSPSITEDKDGKI